MEQTHAQWPPFTFRLIPSHENGKITYQIEFESEVDWPMEDLTFKIPLPKGTRFLAAHAIPVLDTSFDGAEVTFFSPFLDREIRKGGASFVVEVIDPTMTLFSTHAWITWQGTQPGDYLTDEVFIDITRQSLDWQEPLPPNLELKLSASVSDGVVTYIIYPRNISYSKNRMLDVKIKVPIPAGATFLSAEAPSSFVTSFDGREVSFTTLEMERRVKIEPLKIKVAIADVQDSELITHVWASWKNAGKRIGITTVPENAITSPDLLIQLDNASSQIVYYDPIGDVPLPNYDITSIAFEGFKSAFKISFNMVEGSEPLQEPLRFVLNINKDCDDRTGSREKNNFGAEYQVVYRHDHGRAEVKFWDENGPEIRWRYRGKAAVINPVNNRMVSLLAPFDLLDLAGNTHFCWKVSLHNKTTAYTAALPFDWVEPRR
ncbi:MAG: hypothetical protein HYR94_00650 [Chloroflexi bacterium]|nr:hypothetical protein [Chloroflexota bacterium]